MYGTSEEQSYVVAIIVDTRLGEFPGNAVSLETKECEMWGNWGT